ncbi:hypothetical protein FGO68_gene9223 [Halteria grandinella]|uniref:Uncharacterized protein n=1 Tax=Halteria grandinella TaxID=5974 RepID=A0A8J8NEA7_HALGN|nr:hypothetical protein FGO68_gene9223 [Halteria grandinella]
MNHLQGVISNKGNNPIKNASRFQTLADHQSQKGNSSSQSRIQNQNQSSGDSNSQTEPDSLNSVSQKQLKKQGSTISSKKKIEVPQRQTATGQGQRFRKNAMGGVFLSDKQIMPQMSKSPNVRQPEGNRQQLITEKDQMVQQQVLFQNAYFGVPAIEGYYEPQQMQDNTIQQRTGTFNRADIQTIRKVEATIENQPKKQIIPSFKIQRLQEKIARDQFHEVEQQSYRSVRTPDVGQMFTQAPKQQQQQPLSQQRNPNFPDKFHEYSNDFILQQQYFGGPNNVMIQQNKRILISQQQPTYTPVKQLSQRPSISQQQHHSSFIQRQCQDNATTPQKYFFNQLSQRQTIEQTPKQQQPMAAQFRIVRNPVVAAQDETTEKNWLEKSADMLQDTYEQQTIGMNQELEMTQFIDLKEVKRNFNLMPQAPMSQEKSVGGAEPSYSYNNSTISQGMMNRPQTNQSHSPMRLADQSPSTNFYYANNKPAQQQSLRPSTSHDRSF